jgi:predicted ester cyclase
VPGTILYRLAQDQSDATKIVEHWMQFDTLALMQQLEVQP